jgi:pyruvate,water dikinase
VVQARPLTALPPAPVKANRLQREAGAVCAELLPVRPFPLDMTAWTLPGWFAILARMVAEVPAIRIDVRQMFPEVDGVVTQLLPPEPHPTWRTLTTPGRVRSRLHRYDPARWTADPRYAAFERRLGELRDHDPVAMGWRELMAVPEEVFDLLNRFVDVRIDYLPAVAVSVLRLRVWLAVLGMSAEFWPLLAGQATHTRAANDELQAIARKIQHTSAWAEAFATLDGPELTAAVWHADAFHPLRDALQRWLDAYGHRETTSAALVSSPSWAEDPELLLGSLRGLVAQPPGRDTASDPGAVERRIRDRRRVRFTGSAGRVLRAAKAARAGMTFREDTHFHALRVRPVLRGALLEAGRRLAQSGVLAEPHDIFHLKLDEVRQLSGPASLSPEQQSKLRQLVRDRRRKRAEFGEAPLISPATLYPGLARPAPNALVSGTPGGGGRATGLVRVIRQPSEFGDVQPGEVLVCPYTNPSWTPLFQLAAAVVADSGSFGSHAAIVAREYGIPAVMGTGNGTQVLHDGLPVTVDGLRGDVVAADHAQTHG